MIILQTGVPGSGKTASVVNMLMSDESYTHFTDKDGQKKKRPLFVNGIPELQIEHEELSDQQIKEQGLQDFLPYGSLVIIDEAQRLMGMRSAAVKVPEHIEKLALHRHHGLDIVLITQHPSFLDSFVRRLVQRHMHISIKPVGRKLYEWNECIDQPDNASNIAKAIERSFVLPKKAFGQYKSAEVHTKPKRRIPKSLIFMIIFLPLLIAFTAYTFLNMKKRYSSEETASAVSDGHAGGYAAPPSAVQGKSLTPDLYVPVLAEKPESKPLYDNVRQVKTFERIAACISGGNSGCTCYSDQATPLKEITAAMCRDYVKNGLPFNPYKEPENAQNNAYEPTPSPPPP
ncbi:zonular occludens toxin domain-containing protein [Neisseria sp. Dent CA1/247]|uniref:zonular occludens toxin family protein n=1 Tax=Neisseria sp. Dent CA1/247 TaxID=2912675 RepID=UPI001FD028EA|nr:zonular occludens toxin domain-containing protein [Neisseria sp. Dent CA1/247]UOO76747.1 zonular occludens toxin domain-containing protein [Neisseria sp. Dent CA1/247]